MPYIPNQPREVYDAGAGLSAFNAAYEFLKISRQTGKERNPPSLDYCQIAIASLSAELFIKSNFIFRKGLRPRKGHNLEDLINNLLSEEQRNDTKNVIRHFFNRDPDPVITSHANFFEKYRYHYELNATMHLVDFNLNLAEILGAVTYINYVRPLKTAYKYNFRLHFLNHSTHKRVKVPFLKGITPEVVI